MPLSQAVVLDIYPLEKRASAMAMSALDVMIGPIMGPILGGWLTDALNWRWVFYINVPFGISRRRAVAAARCRQSAQSRAIRHGRLRHARDRLAALQLLLDRGTQHDWFIRTEIVIEAGLALGAFWMFVVHTLTARAPLIPRGAVRRPQFLGRPRFIGVMRTMMFAGLALLPTLLQSLLGSSVPQSGFLTMPRGVGTLFSMLVVGRLTGRVDARLLS